MVPAGRSSFPTLAAAPDQKISGIANGVFNVPHVANLNPEINIPADPDDHVFAVSGCIHRCIEAGVPQPLVIPLRPWDKPSKPPGPDGKTDAGKSPAFFNGDKWQHLKDWRTEPVHPGILHDASELGANAGLLLGTPVTVTGPQFLAIDVDLDQPAPAEEPGMVQARNLCVSALAGAFGPDLLIRESRPYRALALLAHADIHPGHKTTYKLAIRSPEGSVSIGKVEVLSTGQQCLIAGKHPHGYLIKWHRAGRPDERRLPAPPIQDGIATVPSFDAAMQTLAVAFDTLRKQGLEITLASQANASNAPVPAAELAPADLTIDDLIAVIDGMLNVAAVDYDTYADVLISIDGTAKGIIAHRGELSAANRNTLESAVVRWMCRWDHRNRPSPEDALAAWQGDWGRPDKERRKGWARLTRLYKDLTRADPADAFDPSPEAEEQRRRHTEAVVRAASVIAKHPLDYLPDTTPTPAGGIDRDRLFDSLGKSSGGDYFAEAKAEMFKPVSPDEPPPASTSTLTILTPSQCGDARQRPYVIKRIIGMGDTGILSGLPGAGKSALAPHWAYAVAQGRKVHGLRVRQGPVLYVAAEDGDGMRVRVRALMARYGDAPDFHLIPHDVDLMHDGASLTDLINAVRRIRPILIVIDTLKRAFPGIKENSGEDDGMGRVIYVSRGLARICNSAVLILHHMPHGADRSRGHTSLPADVDVDMVIKTNPDTKVRTVSFLKNRNGTSDKTMSFGVREQQLGADEDGDPITAVVVDEISDQAIQRPTSPESKLSEIEGKALNVLRDIAPPGTKVTEEAWKLECENQRISTATTLKGRNQAFNRTHGPLIAAKLIGMGDGMAWTIPQQREVAEFEAERKPVGKPLEGLF
jgi:hypothetical protein